MNTILGIKFRDYGQIYFFTLPTGQDVSSPVSLSPPAVPAEAVTMDDGEPDSGSFPDPAYGPLPATIDADPSDVLQSLGPSDCGPGDPACPLHVGDLVLAETGQGIGIGKVVHIGTRAPEGLALEDIKPILRATTEADRDAINEVDRLGRDAFTFCTRRIRGRDLDMKLVDVEVLFDRSKFIFYFTAPTRIDFRELVKDLVREYHVRIELRQIGVRHETQMIGAVGNCGMVCCCRRFLRKFAPVTIKMAKEQNLFLNPSKISGICGRLLCCLSYEQENYDAFHRECPRLGKRYQTSLGDMKVLRANMFRNSVIVLNPAGEEVEMTLEEWQDAEPQRPESQPQPKPPRPQRPQGDGLMVVAADPDSLESPGAFAALDDLEAPEDASAPDDQQGRAPRRKRKRRGG